MMISFIVFQRLIVCARSSEAFEIWVDGHRVWSRLKQNRMPDTNELDEIFEDLKINFRDFKDYR